VGINILEELSEFSDGLVEHRKKLVCLKLELNLELVNGLELKTHSYKQGNLNI
jgi:hypothetical protein